MTFTVYTHFKNIVDYQAGIPIKCTPEKNSQYDVPVTIKVDDIIILSNQTGLYIQKKLTKFEKKSSLTLPCMVMADAPLLSAILASLTATIWSLSHPILILTVTGTSLAFVTASIMLPAKFKSHINLLPSPFFTTFGAGQPMLISTISAILLTLFLHTCWITIF